MKTSLKWYLLMILCCCALRTHAQGVITFSQRLFSGGSGGVDQVQGWEFVPNTDVTVVQLGLYDGHEQGGFVEQHTVSIWDTSEHSLVSGVLGAGDSAALIGSFRFVDVSPITLLAGQTYIIGAFMPTPVTDFTWGFSGPTSILNFDPRITVTALRSGLSPDGISFPVDRDANWLAAIGPNFVIAEVPEVSSSCLLLVGIGGLFCTGGGWRKQVASCRK